jgi:enoyl-CoA hydratase/carnithine racemase
MTSRQRISGREAERIGFATAVVPARTAVEAATALVAQIAENVAPSALHALRRLVRTEPDWAVLDDIGRDVDSAERREGTAAFLEKRPPRFRH